MEIVSLGLFKASLLIGTPNNFLSHPNLNLIYRYYKKISNTTGIFNYLHICYAAGAKCIVFMHLCQSVCLSVRLSTQKLKTSHQKLM